MKSQVIIDKIQAKLDAYDQSKRVTFKVFQINCNDSDGSLLKSIVLDLKEFKIYEGTYDSPDGSITIADEDFFGLATKTVQAADLLAADKIQLDGDFEAIKKLLDRLTE